MKNRDSKSEIPALATKRDKIIAERNTIRASYQAMAEQKADLEEAIAKCRAAVSNPDYDLWLSSKELKNNTFFVNLCFIYISYICVAITQK